MNIGMIGAGKVGFSIGKYLTERGIRVTGYYSRSHSSAEEAADFTDTRAYDELDTLVEDSDALFLTVPDGAIASVWQQIRTLPVENKIISHFSGAVSSAVFSDIGLTGAYGYSIHPLFAVSDKYNSYKELPRALFTIEGDEAHLSDLKGLFERAGNRVEIISAEHKMRYHAAAAMASNLYAGLVRECEQLLMQCGFSAENAHEALVPLITGNVESIVRKGPAGALTGPIERNDVSTVRNHLAVLSGEDLLVYRTVSRQVLLTAREKHPDRDYSEMEKVLQS